MENIEIYRITSEISAPNLLVHLTSDRNESPLLLAMQDGEVKSKEQAVTSCICRISEAVCLE